LWIREVRIPVIGKTLFAAPLLGISNLVWVEFPTDMRVIHPETRRFGVSHPWHKNKNVPGMGQPGSNVALTPAGTADRREEQGDAPKGVLREERSAMESGEWDWVCRRF
jgi:hypothetical protein